MNGFSRGRAAWALGLACSIAAAQHYSIVDLTAGSPFRDTSAYGISQDGHVTGYGTNPITGELHTFIYYRGVFTDLGDLGYVNGATASQINDAGMVTGVGYPASQWECFVYQNGTASPIGGSFTSPNSMNSLGDIVGFEHRDDGGYDAFSYIGGQFTSLSNLISARGINDSDVYVGAIGHPWHHNGVNYLIPHGYIYKSGTYTDLGDLGGGSGAITDAYSVNNSNQVTGYSTAADGTSHAFLYAGTTMSDLGTFPPYTTVGTSINDSGRVVGNIQTSNGGEIGIFLYSNGALHKFADIVDASGAGWTALNASQINNKGYIVGYGAFNGGTHGFLARPYAVGLPTAFSIVKGQYVAGALSDLFAIDGSYLLARTSVARRRSDIGVTVALNGTSTQASPSNLLFLLTSHVNSTNLGRRSRCMTLSLTHGSRSIRGPRLSPTPA